MLPYIFDLVTCLKILKGLTSIAPISSLHCLVDTPSSYTALIGELISGHTFFAVRVIHAWNRPTKFFSTIDTERHIVSL